VIGFEKLLREEISLLAPMRYVSHLIVSEFAPVVLTGTNILFFKNANWISAVFN
jgi:hypothetical protein